MVLTDAELDRGLRAVIQATDPIVKLQLLSEVAAQSLNAGSDMTNVRNGFSTEVTRRNALDRNLRHGPG